MPAPWETGGNPVPVRVVEPGGPLSALNALGQGLTFGFSDEMAAALAASTMAPFSRRTWPEIYEAQLEAERANLAAGRERSPVLSAGAEIAGAVGSGVAGARGAAALGRAVAPKLTGALAAKVPAIARLAGVGAVEGAVYGAGTAEQGARARGAATGAAVGGVAAPVAGGAMTVAGKIGKRLVAPVGRIMLNSPRTQAVRNVITALEADDIMPDEAVKRLNRLGPQAVLADLGPNAQATARATAGQMGRARSIASSFLRGRQRGQTGRLTRELVDIDPRDFRRGFLKFLTNRQTASAPVYREAFNQPLEVTPRLGNLLNRPAMRRAMSRAARLMGDEGGGYGHLRLIDQGKQVLDDDIGQAIRQGRRNEARILTRLKNDILDEIDTQLGGGDPANSVYRQARNIYAGEAQLRDAATMGRNVMRPSMDLDAAEIALESMSRSEQDAFRAGVVRSVLDTIEKTADTSNTANRMIRSPRVRQAVRLAFPDDDAFERFVSTAEAESVFSQTRNVVEGGSRTAEFMRDIQSIDEGASAFRSATYAGNDPISAGMNILKTLGFGDASPETLEEMAKLLFSRGEGLNVLNREAARVAKPAMTAIERSAATGAGTVAGITQLREPQGR